MSSRTGRAEWRPVLEGTSASGRGLREVLEPSMSLSVQYTLDMIEETLNSERRDARPATSGTTVFSRGVESESFNHVTSVENTLDDVVHELDLSDDNGIDDNDEDGDFSAHARIVNEIQRLEFKLNSVLEKIKEVGDQENREIR